MILILFILIIALIAANIKIVPQAKAYVVERLGAYNATWETGLHFKIPLIDKVARKVSLKENVIDFPPQPAAVVSESVLPSQIPPPSVSCSIWFQNSSSCSFKI